MQRPCITCGKRIANGSRCTSCGYAVERKRSQDRGTRYTWAERERMRRAVAEYIEQHGLICPGIGREPHQVDKLTANHSTPVEFNGTGSPLVVCCQSCNNHDFFLQKSRSEGRG